MALQAMATGQHDHSLLTGDGFSRRGPSAWRRGGAHLDKSKHDGRRRGYQGRRPSNFAGKWSAPRAHFCLKEGPTNSVPPSPLTRRSAALTAAPPPVDQTPFSLEEQASNGGWHEPGFYRAGGAGALAHELVTSASIFRCQADPLVGDRQPLAELEDGEDGEADGLWGFEGEVDEGEE